MLRYLLSRPSGDGTSRYLAFLNGGKTAHGRTLQDILDYTDDQVEFDHQFIQWIFPLPETSAFNSDAPQIDIQKVLASELAHEKVLLAYEKMRNYWGIGDTIDTKRMRLLNGHNGLRFSRALQSLVYHGHPQLAQGLLDKVLANRQGLRPSMYKGTAKTLWQHLLEQAKVKVGGEPPAPEQDQRAETEAEGEEDEGSEHADNSEEEQESKEEQAGHGGGVPQEHQHEEEAEEAETSAAEAEEQVIEHEHR